MLMSEKSPQCILTCSACPGSRGVGGGALLPPAAGARKLILSIIQLHTSLSGNKASHYLPTQTISEHRGHQNTNTTPSRGGPHSQHRDDIYGRVLLFYVQPSQNPRTKMLKDAQIRSSCGPSRTVGLSCAKCQGDHPIFFLKTKSKT